jgi:hypothetical protein
VVAFEAPGGRVRGAVVKAVRNSDDPCPSNTPGGRFKHSNPKDSFGTALALKHTPSPSTHQHINSI